METDYWQKPIVFLVLPWKGSECEWMKALGVYWIVISLALIVIDSEGWPSHHSSLTFLWFELSAIQWHSLISALVGQVYKLIKVIIQIQGGRLLVTCFMVLSDKPSCLLNDPTQNVVQRVIR